jgi:hypothetical protein
LEFLATPAFITGGRAFYPADTALASHCDLNVGTGIIVTALLHFSTTKLGEFGAVVPHDPGCGKTPD